MTSDILRLIDRHIERSRILQEAARSAGTEAPPPHGPTIVISRQLGSGGKLVAERVAERLGFALWDRNLVDAVANDADVARRIVQAFDEKTVSEIEVLARTIAGQRDVGGFMYKRHLAHALLAISRHGDAVIVGRGANFLLPQALSVRVIASEAYRIHNLVTFEGLTEDEAKKTIHTSDKERAAFVRNTYDRDISDPLAYDVVAVVDCFGIEGVVELVLTALTHRQTAAWRRPSHVV